MLSFAHTLISLPFAVYLNNPVLIFLAAAVGHLFCDTLRHWNIYPRDFKRYPVLLVALDVIGGVAVAAFIMGPAFFTVPVLAAIAGGNMPDILHAGWDALSPKQKKRLPPLVRWCFIFHERLQLETYHVARGLLSQAALVAISLRALLR